MRKKTIKIIQIEQFENDLLNYAISYSNRVIVDNNNENIKNKFSLNINEIDNLKQSTIKEENSNSDNESNDNNSNLISHFSQKKKFNRKY